MQPLGKKYGRNIEPFITANPPFPLPAFWGSGRMLRQLAFRFSRIIAVNLVAFLNDCWFPFLGPRKERLYS
jgi:hypothetical protein